MRHLLTVPLLTIVVLLMTAGVAAADPATPTHYRSAVTAVTGPDGDPPGDLDVEVMGGDAFLVVSVGEGRALTVPGYEDEPYIRVLPDGTVEINERSPARWLNDARYGSLDVDLPAIADADAPPDWQPVADAGTYGWHDHRIHYMSPALPSQIDPDLDEVQPVRDWELAVTLDDEPVLIEGELDWVPGPSPTIPVVTFLLLFAVGLLIAGRGDRAVAALVGVASVAGLVLGAANNIGLPAGVEGVPSLLILPLVSLVALLVAHVLHRRHDRRAWWLVAGAAIPVVVVSVLLAGAVTRPFVPGMLPAAVARILVVAIPALAIAAVVAVGQRVLAMTSLDAAEDG